VKILTGGDDLMTVRRQYESEFTFKPGAKVWLFTNHLPTIRGTDEAIWRRIWLIPFNVTIPEEKRDPHMGDWLIKEAPGILNWCLGGLREYLQAGKLEQPEIVTQATSAYREDQDILGDFLSERCDVGPGFVCTAGDLFKSYTNWCTLSDEKPLNQRAFGSAMGERFARDKIDSKRHYLGVKLKSQRDVFEKSQDGTDEENGRSRTHESLCTKLSSRDNMKRSYEKPTQASSCDQTPKLKRLENLISEYDLPPDIDISRHIKFTKTGRYCTCKGCGEPASWQALDKVRPLPLCDRHHQELKTAGDRPP
jgi:phage/plasmid-associated DNA primase